MQDDTSTATIDYPFGDALPDSGQTIEVAPGVRWVRMKLPFALDHINLWLLRDQLDGRPGWTIVDCGIANQDTLDAWSEVFATQLEGLPVLRVVVTHMHPDHVGNALWLTERWSTPDHPCRLWMSAADYQAAQLACQHTTHGGERAASFFASHGLTDPEAVAKIRARTNYFGAMVPGMPPTFHRLMDGLGLRIGPHQWTCHAGYGHAPEHMALHCPDLNVLISGDMVLPRISTNVSVYDNEPEGNALTLFLQSLERMRSALPADTLVLPSHGKPFTGLHARIDQLHEHHRERLNEVIAACRQQPTTAAELLPVLFKRQLDLHQTTFAMGEAVAHLHALWHQGTLTRTLGADGIHRFSCGPAAEAS